MADENKIISFGQDQTACSPEEILRCAGEEKILEVAFFPGKDFSLQEAAALSLPEQIRQCGAEKLILCLREEFLQIPEGKEEEDPFTLFYNKSKEVIPETELFLYLQKMPSEALLKRLFSLKSSLTFALDESNAHYFHALLSEPVFCREKALISFAVMQGKEESRLVPDFAKVFMDHSFTVKSHCLTLQGELPDPGKDGNQPLCMKPLYSCFVDQDAKVYPCMGKGFPLGDLREKSLQEILLESKFLELLRQHPRRIKEPCFSCPQITRCCGGCRIRAYQVTGDYLAADPYCINNHHKQDQIRKLPLCAKGLLPHANAMELIDQIIFLSEEYSIHEAVIRPDNPFLNEAGFLERSALPEYAAQACAVRDSVEKGGKPSPGLLSEVKSCTFYDIPVRAGDKLRITVRTEFHMDIWYGIAFRIETGENTLISQGALKICIYDETPAPY